MAEKTIHEMISAYAAGCMDRENFINFKDYIDNDGELPYGELGEIQNLIAMIPLILEIELPDAKLKEILVSNLISMPGEIKAKISKERRIEKKEKADILLPTEKFYKSKVNKDLMTKTFEKSLQSPPAEVYEKKIDSKSKPDNRQFVNQTIKRKKPFSRFALWMGLGTVVLFLIGVTYYFYDLNKSLIENVAVLKEEITLLQDEISSNSEFLVNYDMLIQFFSYKDIAVIDLASAEEDSEAFGKFFIAYGQLKGLLELNKMPSLSPEESYQLWIVSRGASYSLGVFRPSINDRYFQISQIPYFSIRDLQLVRLTLEPAEGSNSPQGQTKLFGVISGNNLRRRR